MALWVGELQVKTSPISEVEKFLVTLILPGPLYHRFQLESECLGGLFRNLFDALNQLYSWFLCTSLGLCTTSQNVSGGQVAKISKNSKSNLKFLNAVWSKPYTVPFLV